MRQRILTPFFPVPGGESSAVKGLQSPPDKGVPATALEGRVVGNGRYLLRKKTSHSQEAVRYIAYDLVGGIEITLELHPDTKEVQGYRLGRSDATPPNGCLPNLYKEEVSSTKSIEKTQHRDKKLSSKIFRVLNSALGAGSK